MKITCSTEHLRKNLQAVQRAVANKGILPVLSNVLFTSLHDSEGHIKIIGTDLEIGVESRLEIGSAEKINITIPAKKLFEIVNKFPDETVHFDFHENGSVDLIGEKLKFNLNTLPADDFPRLPHVNRDTQFSLGCHCARHWYDDGSPDSPTLGCDTPCISQWPFLRASLCDDERAVFGNEF